MNVYINTDHISDKELAAKLLASSFEGTELAGSPETDEEYGEGIFVQGEKWSADLDSLPDADDRATDEAAVLKAYEIEGATVFILSSEYERGLYITDPGTTAKQIVITLETGDLDLPQHLASWGFDGTPDEADDDAQNVRVWCEPCYYAGSIGAPIGHYVSDDRGQELIFSTTANAQEWIDNAESGAYVLGSGEAGRPTYTICA
jgi:hypothetical protein